MIKARGLTKRYGDKLAVDQLTFTVEPGRITGFLGPNGAGKTTTMRLIRGLDRPTGGSVTVCGAGRWSVRGTAGGGKRRGHRGRPWRPAARLPRAWGRQTG